jgi:hypothetical protein
MKRLTPPPIVIVWTMAFLGPFLAAVGAWCLTAMTTSARACTTGNGSGSTLETLAVGAALVLITPIAIGCYGWRRDPYAPRVASAVVTSILLAPPLIFLAVQIWWSAHNCMT